MGIKPVQREKLLVEKGIFFITTKACFLTQFMLITYLKRIPA